MTRSDIKELLLFLLIFMLLLAAVLWRPLPRTRVCTVMTVDEMDMLDGVYTKGGTFDELS